MILFNDTQNSGVVNFGTAIGVLDTETRQIETGLNAGNAGVDNVNKLEYTVYFLDASGAEDICSGTKELNF